MKKIISILIVLISLISCEKSDDTPKQLNTDFNQNILDSFSVSSIAFDKQNNTWIGTKKQGLIKYNSSETIFFNSSNSMLSDTSSIFDIAIDANSNIWIGTDKLVKYDGKNFTSYDSENTEVIEQYVESISSDSKGNIWFTTCTHGNCRLVKFDGTTWTLFTQDTYHGCPTNFVWDFVIDKNDNVWFPLINNSSSRLAKLADDSWVIYQDQDLDISNQFIHHVDVNGKNELVGAIDFSMIANVINPDSDVFVFNGSATSKFQYDTIADIKKLFIDNLDNIWVIDQQRGFGVFDGKKWIKDNSKFLDYDLFTIEQSNDNKIWIGTSDGIFIND